jgi:transposase InsO family protein
MKTYHVDVDLTALRPAVQQREHIYNMVQPHRALGYSTPAEYPAHHAR